MSANSATDDLRGLVLPQFFPAHWLVEAPDIVSRDFPSRIRIGYVVRGNGSYSYLMRSDLDSAGISADELHSVALSNLRSLPMPELKIGKTPGGPELYLGETDDNFVAARILLPIAQRVFAAELGDEFYAAIPCRDWFICWSRNQADDWKSRNAESAKKIFFEDEYNLSPDVFLVSNGVFSVFLKQSHDA